MCFPTSFSLSFHSNLCFDLELGSFDPQQRITGAHESGNHGCPPGHRMVLPLCDLEQRLWHPWGPQSPLSPRPLFPKCLLDICAADSFSESPFPLLLTCHQHRVLEILSKYLLNQSPSDYLSSHSLCPDPRGFFPGLLPLLLLPSLSPFNLPHRRQSSLSQTHTSSCHCPAEKLSAVLHHP